SVPTTQRATAPQSESSIDGKPFVASRLVGAWRLRQAVSLTRFEQGAMQRFVRDPSHSYDRRTYVMHDGNPGYLYAEPQYLRNDCLPCHQNGVAGWVPPSGSMAISTTQPATSPAAEPSGVLLGMVSVDMPSQVATNEVLLNHTFILTAGLGAGSLAILI